ncbi:hypothetical protein [Longimicrobium terrae]|uniref:Uncharacterized protein n=1 Tax=Longimicrobium terrae TaxID=1639882 RepID=A0A841H1C2_9BACT|nr:hypothetical protein [Longimicrobium terrae]MBB4637384.1 hypothetical protein [Longimicrobium terrae]MBB6071782.1 hypothetical protein [Longimicrobium terrae]NNC28542.1 hypothetical protein [Longimicrobium terrae]
MLRLKRPAHIALLWLDPEDRDAVNQSITHLLELTRPGTSYDDVEAYSVRPANNGSYMLTVDSQWGLFFSEQEGDLVVSDVFPLGRLEMFGHPTKNPDP